MGLLENKNKIQITITCHTFKQVHLIKKFFRFCHLTDYGYDCIKKERTFTALVSGSFYEKSLDFAKQHGIRIKIVNEFTERDADCRNKYFETHQPTEGKMWRCAYCGYMFKRHEVEIDHLYPVDKVQTDPGLQKILEKKGYTTINDPKNLVVACKACNKKKSNKMGKWIIKGKLGRHEMYWTIRHTSEVAAVILLFINRNRIFDGVEAFLKMILGLFTQ